MGNCCTGDEKENLNSSSIDKKLKRLKVQIDNEIKILLLGTGDSGKSTVVKQMRLINNMDFDQEEREEFVETIRLNVIQNTKSLVYAMESLGVEYSSEKIQQIGESIKKLPPMVSILEEESVDKIKTLWSDKGIQEIWERRSEYQINDTAPFYFDRIDEIAKSDYLPNNQDILHLRVKTTGIMETQFESSELGFRMFDVGGQRNERKKWIHCFQDVTALIFCVSMSEYDQTLYEDETQKRMTESLKLFEEICNAHWFENSSMILFLNKKDIFEEKIKKIDLNVCFLEYSGGLDYKLASEYIRDQFLRLNRNQQKKIYPHFTCATDTSNIKKVFDAVKDTVLSDLLRDVH
ncbi:guanine nucleotide-binding protein g(o) subunit alpha [Anaeramoeba flamelloides]|uniref:Guanine nucleotide-binding protein g(O) subunit alpha n=1 Tax=Anaeramoeba flamelloides TaxID=1746091 RepID=A0AAV7Z0J7_9EUKA|nr:guanine nucleotide-binding protein g(o) subunit alpha [Anaeramoeba flamelloides]